jgi:hypothetical protein
MTVAAMTERERQECEQLEQLVARRRREQDRRPASVAVAVSLDAFRRWGVRPPKSFTAKHRRRRAGVARQLTKPQE